MFSISFDSTWQEVARHSSGDGRISAEGFNCLMSKEEILAETKREKRVRESRSRTNSFGLSPESDWPLEVHKRQSQMEEGRPKRRYVLTTGTGTGERERKAKGPAAAPHSRSECRSQKRERAGTRRKWPRIETGLKRGRSVSLAVLGKEGGKTHGKKVGPEAVDGAGSVTRRGRPIRQLGDCSDRAPIGGPR